jgi:hypothetical protein
MIDLHISSERFILDHRGAEKHGCEIEKHL